MNAATRPRIGMSTPAPKLKPKFVEEREPTISSGGTGPGSQIASHGSQTGGPGV